MLFLEWFFYHPALRYGGYHLIALLLFVPFAIFFEKKINFEPRSILKIKFLIFIIFVIFFVRNIDRIHNEYQVYKYNFLSYPSYNLEFQNLSVSKRISKIKNVKTLKMNAHQMLLKFKKILSLIYSQKNEIFNKFFIIRY